MQILGIDPGYATTGFGVLQTERGQLHLLNYGTITTPAGLTLSRRLVMLYDDMMELLSTVKPDVWRSRSFSGGTTSRPVSV